MTTYTGEDIRLPVDDEVEDALTLLLDEAMDSETATQYAVFAIDNLWERESRRTLYGMLRDARRRQARISDRMAYALMVAAEADRANDKDRQAYAFLEEQIGRLAEQLLPEGSKHIDVPGAGRVQYRDLAAYARIADPEAFIGALGADEKARLVEMRPHLLTADAKKYAEAALKESGELLAGVERVEARRTASIDYETGPK